AERAAPRVAARHRRRRHRGPAALRRVHERVSARHLDLRAAPWIAALLGVGLMIAFSALALRLHGLAFGDSPRRHTLHAWRLAPMALHLLLVAAAGIYLPGTIVSWFRHVASQLG